MDPQKESLRRLFDSIAGKDMEVDWMELKRILDHSMRDGRHDIEHLKVVISKITLFLDLPKPVVYNRFSNNMAFETQAAGPGDDGAGACGLLSLICGPFLKGTPFEEQLGMNDQSNKRLIGDDPNSGGPVTANGEIQNGLTKLEQQC